MMKLLLLFVWMFEPSEMPPTPEEETYLNQLASDDFDKRELAEEWLDKQGRKSMPIIKKGIKSEDPEVSLRCERIMSRYLYIGEIELCPPISTLSGQPDYFNPWGTDKIEFPKYNLFSYAAERLSLKAIKKLGPSNDVHAVMQLATIYFIEDMRNKGFSKPFCKLIIECMKNLDQ